MTNIAPEKRAQIIAGILQHIAETPAASTYDTVFRRALAGTGLPEEEIADEIRAAISCLIFSGIVLSNGFVRERAEVYFSADMEMVPGPWALRFVWGDRVYIAENDQGGRA